METIHKEVREGTKALKLIYDRDSESPREWDNLGKLVGAHGSYNFFDETAKNTDRYGSWKEWADNEIPKGSVVLPVYMYDHSGITISTNAFNCRWDSGQVGWIYATREAIRENFGVQRVTKKQREQTEKQLIAEIKTLDDYLTGNVYGYVYEEDGEQVESCWGYIGNPKEWIGEIEIPVGFEGIYEIMNVQV